MKSVILISANPQDLDCLSEIFSKVGSVHRQSRDRVVVEGDWGWFALGIDDKLKEEFSEVERVEVSRFIFEPSYAQLEYSNPSAVNLAIELIPATAKLLVDNDRGVLRSIEAVRDLIRAGSDWQTS